MASSSYSQRNPPISLLEFGDLVSSALDSGRFPELQLEIQSYDPGQFSQPAPVQSPSSLETSTLTTSPTTAPNSRPRRMFDKIKRQASALVMRPPKRHQDLDRGRSSPCPPASEVYVPIPSVSIAASYKNGSLHSASSSIWCDDESDYIPYLPLASQYEAARPYSTSRRSGSTSSLNTTATRSSPRSFTPSSLSTYSYTHPSSISSSSSSSWRARITQGPSPPSPTHSTRSFSSLSSANTEDELHFPVTPVTAHFPSSSNSPTSHPARWSVGTVAPDEEGHATVDPFAKGTVQIVRSSPGHHSISSHSSSGNVSKSSLKSSRTRKRPVPLAPLNPPPSCPLPVPPRASSITALSFSSSDEEDVEVEWTLRLGAPPGRAASIGSISQASRITNSSADETSVERATKSIRDIMKERNLKRDSRTIKPAKVMPHTSDDWTLSLPFPLAKSGCPSSWSHRGNPSTRPHSYSHPSVHAASSARGVSSSSFPSPPPIRAFARSLPAPPKRASAPPASTSTFVPPFAPPQLPSSSSLPSPCQRTDVPRKVSFKFTPPPTACSTTSTTSTGSTSSSKTIIPLRARTSTQVPVRGMLPIGPASHASTSITRPRSISSSTTRPDPSSGTPAPTFGAAFSGRRASVQGMPGSHEEEARREASLVKALNDSGDLHPVWRGEDGEGELEGSESESMISGTYYSARSSLSL